LPPAGHPLLAAGAGVKTCGACHPETVRPDGTIDVAAGKHLNGLQDGFAGHPADWLTKGSADFHGRAVVQQGATPCFQCHSAKAPATVAVLTCATCHDPLSGGDWTRSCKGCHGSAVNAAPPADVDGNSATTAVGVGAHQSHVTGAHGVSAPLDCVYCHQKPVETLAPGHMDGTVQLTGYTGSDAAMAAALPSQGWNDAAATCSNYCHGATLKGGTVPRPVWTLVNGTQGACGACHGLPPTGHPILAAGSTIATCSVCHPETVKPDGTIDVPGGRHVNGRLDGFAGHGPGFADPRTSNFHGIAIAANGVETCWRCHAAKAPAMVSALTCASCHDALAGGGDWTTSCFGCHGDRSANSAPPKDTRGNLLTPAVGVGAHQVHVTASHGLTAPLDCVFCHEKPATMFAPAHFDGRTAVTGYTGTDAALLASVKDPGWNRTSATCATSWCHGSYSGTFTYTFDDGSGTQVQKNFAYRGTPVTPTWTRVDGTQAACGTCHGTPPRGPVWHSGGHGGGNGCNLCHPGVRSDGSGFVDPSHHLDGVVDVTPTFVSACFGCH
jgi:predicted CxxxxCH...CXXCH cytochrome family protein